MTWIIRTDDGPLEVIGPYRRHGTIYAVSAEEQRAWARTFAARLPTPGEFDLIWQSADVRVMPRPRDVATASLSSLHEDAAALGSVADRHIACGKTWVQGGTSSRAVNYGWHLPSSEVVGGQTWKGIRVYPCALFPEVDAYVIQPPAKAHGWSHVDYSQAGYCVRPARDTYPSPDSQPDTRPDPARFDVRSLPDRLGLRCCAWLGHEYGQPGGVVEIPGPEHNPRILAYSEHCRRPGRFLGVRPDGMPRWDGGTPLRAPSDEWSWCMIIQSAALLGSLRPGERVPHGLRVSVREAWEDAQRVGTSRPPEYDPRPGDLQILARYVWRGGKRVLADPTRGDNGHVRRYVGIDDEGRHRFFGGNESTPDNPQGELVYDLDGPLRPELLRGWIAV